MHTDDSWEFWEDVSCNHNNSGLLHIDPKHMESTDGQKKNRRDFDSVCPIRICRTVAGRRDAMSLFFMFSLKHLIFMSRWENSVRKEDTTHNFVGQLYPLDQKDLIIQFTQETKASFVKSAQKSSRYVYRMCFERRVPLDRRGTRRRSERQRCIRSLRQKIQRERSGEFKCWRTIFPVANGSKKTGWSTSSHLQPGSILFDFGWRYQCMPSRRRSISGSYFVATSCLNREKYMRAKAQTCYQRNWDEYLDIEQEHIINNHWHVDSERPQSRSWIGLTIFTVLKTPPPDGHLWAGERLTEIRATFWAWWHQARGMVENV